MVRNVLGRNFQPASGATASAIFFGFWPKSAPELMNHPKKRRAPVSTIDYTTLSHAFSTK